MRGENLKDCKLELLLKMQKKFQNKFSYHPPLHLIASAIMHEGGELWTVSRGKWWSKKTYPKEEQIEELIDILHFWLIYCVELNLSPDEILDSYSKKLAENYRRQIRGY